MLLPGGPLGELYRGDQPLCSVQTAQVIQIHRCIVYIYAVSTLSSIPAAAVSCVLLEKSGAGLRVASSCYWDQTTDGSCTVRWENQAIACIVNVFGLAV